MLLLHMYSEKCPSSAVSSMPAATSVNLLSDAASKDGSTRRCRNAVVSPRETVRVLRKVLSEVYPPEIPAVNIQSTAE